MTSPVGAATERECAVQVRRAIVGTEPGRTAMTQEQTCEHLPRPGPSSVQPWSCPVTSPPLTLNLGIVAHVDAGKTSLTERLLYEAGAIDVPGSVDAGTTRTDSMDLERRRGITIRAAVTSFAVDDLAVNLVDTPGHPDFIAEVERSLGVLDAAVLVLSSRGGRAAADGGDLAGAAAHRRAHRAVRQQGGPLRRRRRPPSSSRCAAASRRTSSCSPRVTGQGAPGRPGRPACR